MKVLVCPNTWRNRYVSALSEKKMEELAHIHDVVVNEFSEDDMQEGRTDYWAHMAIADDVSATRVRTALTAANLKFDDLPASNFRWQEGRIGLSVLEKADRIVAALRAVATEIVEYAGPSGH